MTDRDRLADINEALSQGVIDKGEVAWLIGQLWEAMKLGDALASCSPTQWPRCEKAWRKFSND